MEKNGADWIANVIIVDLCNHKPPLTGLSVAPVRKFYSCFALININGCSYSGTFG
jgi:hypothetical protein